MISWKVLRSELVLDRMWLRVREDRVRTQSGAVIDEFHVIESPAWAATVCLTESQELVLVEQYRHGHGGRSLELPAGVIEPGEEPAAAAARELREETGFEAPSVDLFWSIRPEPARHEQWAHFAFAAGVVRTTDQDLDVTEDVRVVLRPLSEFDAVIAEMVHGLHVAALLLAQRKGLLGPVPPCRE